MVVTMTPDDRIAALERELATARAAEGRMRAIFDNTYQFTGLLDLDGRLVEANRSALALVGLRWEDVAGHHFADTPWWAHSTALQARLRAAIDAARQGLLVRFEATHPGADGQVHTVDFSLKPLRDEAGAVVNLICEGRDLTERKRAEDMLATVLDAIPVRVFWKDRAGRYLGCNTPFARDAGVATIADVLGKTDHDFTWHPQAERYRGDDQAVISTGEPILSYEEPQTAPDGAELWLRTTKLPLRDGAGAVIGVLGIYEDMTARKREEKERLAFEVQLQHAQKLESLGLLAGTIAHDFNNLLTAVVVNVQLLRMQLRGDPGTTPMLDDIATASRRAADLCRQLFAYSGRGENVVGPLDLNELVTEMSSLLRVSISRKANLTVALDPTLSPIHADGTQLRQVVMNLLTNASDALGDGDGEIRLRTTRHQVHTRGELPAGDYVAVEVEDTGCGMDAETQARIFEPFFTTKRTGQGLGLAAVLGIVRAHGGGIEVDSQVQAGTRFRMLLPAAPQAQPAPVIVATAAEPWRGQGRVLLVDDEPALLAAGAKLVAHFGFEVVTAVDGLDALERYEVGKFAMVIVDLTMPRVDGIETMRALRARDPHVKVVLTSGYDIRDMLPQLDRSRPDAFLDKPFSIASLTDVLRRFAAVTAS
jgi:PAS domain S-box-containing protein